MWRGACHRPTTQDVALAMITRMNPHADFITDGSRLFSVIARVARNRSLGPVLGFRCRATFPPEVSAKRILHLSSLGRTSLTMVEAEAIAEWLQFPLAELTYEYLVQLDLNAQSDDTHIREPAREELSQTRLH